MAFAVRALQGVAVLASLKALAGFLAGVWLWAGLLEGNEYGVEAGWPWLVSGLVLANGWRCWGEELSKWLVASVWLLVAAAFANRTLRDVGWAWVPDVEWLLLVIVPVGIASGVFGCLVRDASRLCRRAGWWLWVGLAATPLVLVTAVAWVPLVAVVVYSVAWAGSASSARLLRV